LKNIVQKNFRGVKFSDSPCKSRPAAINVLTEIARPDEIRCHGPPRIHMAVL